MSEEYKISVPLFEKGELETFDNNIHSIVEEYSKLMFKEKNQILTQRIIMKQEEEIKRLNKLISQREKKWEKWTTEKQILSSKMSDYLCKYQNLKREYTKQIKISTDRKKEIERLNNIINNAIDFLKENACIDEDIEYFCDDLRYDDCKKLLDILKGGSKE